jgi:Sec-independent protein secretion pathway component TatC
MARPGLRAADKMTFLEHLDELRVRLMRSMIGIVIALGVCWNWSSQILHFIMQPLRAAYPQITFISVAHPQCRTGVPMTRRGHRG